MSNIHVCRWGSAGPRVVMIHGGGQGTSSAGHLNFWAQEALGDEGWQLLVPDRPGHGASPAPGRPDDADADGAWVAEMLGDGAHLLGHSFGGVVALSAAARRPRAVKSLTLIEPALLKIATSAPAVRKMVLGLAAATILPYSPANRARKFMKIIGIPDEFAGTQDDLSNLGVSLKAARFPSRAAMEGYLATVREAGVPLLVISGTASAGFQAVGAIVAGKGGGEHIVTPSQNHFPQWAGAPFNSILARFWSETEDRVTN